MAGQTKINPVVGNYIGEIRNIGKEVTMIAVDWDVDADASRLAMEAVHNYDKSKYLNGRRCL